jgi:hypothetical protein
MQRAMERHEQGEAHAIAIILRPVAWQGTPLGKLQALPTGAVAVTSGKWHDRDEAFNDVTEKLREVVVSLTEEERMHTIETQAFPQLSRQTVMSPSPHEAQLLIVPTARFGLIRGVISGIRLLAFGIVLTLYWLLIGNIFLLDVFPKKILRISGSPYLYMFLRGDYKKTELLKILIVFFSLTVDWFLVGKILSLVPHPSLFPLQDAFIYGSILAGIFVFLFVGYVTLYYIVKWPYTNVINIRKIIEVIVVTTLLTFVTTPFGASFLYFPLLTSVVSLCLFINGLVSLGGTGRREGSEALNERLERRLQIRLEDEKRSKEYFKERSRER